MPDFGIRNIDLVAETITLEDGRVLSSADLRGNINQQKLNRLTAFVQTFFDSRQVIADLLPEDPDKTATQSELDAKYGGRVFVDGGDLVTRNTLITFTVVDGRLLPHVRRWP